MPRRTRIDIIADMLYSVQERKAMKPTHLMYRANLSHTQMKPYLEELIEKDLVVRRKKGKYDYLIITDKGCEFLRKIREMKQFEKAFGL